MSDLLARAEALAERYNSSGFIHKEATLLLPELIAEIKHLRGDICYPGQCVQMIDAEETICEQRRTIDEQAAEIKRLHAVREAEWSKWDQQVKSFEGTIDNIRAAKTLYGRRMKTSMEQAAYWRKIAIDGRGKLIRLGFGDVIDEIVPSQDERRIAEVDFMVEGQHEAARELESESSKHFSAATKMISMTDERRAAIQEAIIALVAAEQYDGAEGGSLGVDEVTMAILRAMLAEAER